MRRSAGRDRTGTGTAHQRSACRCDSTGSRRGGPSVRAGQPIGTTAIGTTWSGRPSTEDSSGSWVARVVSAVPSPGVGRGEEEVLDRGEDRGRHRPSFAACAVGARDDDHGRRRDATERPLAHVVCHRRFEVGFAPLGRYGPPQACRDVADGHPGRGIAHDDPFPRLAVVCTGSLAGRGQQRVEQLVVDVVGREGTVRTLAARSRLAPPTSGGW